MKIIRKITLDNKFINGNFDLRGQSWEFGRDCDSIKALFRVDDGTSMMM